MKERPILFSAPMVRAILAGTKTQTRRVIKCAPYHQIEERDDGTQWPWMYDAEHNCDHWLPCPYGQPGDKLWVREAWRVEHSWDRMPPRELPGCASVHYEADGRPNAHFCMGKLRPSMFMLRAISRITLEITAVRVERLQEISEEDCVAEGLRAAIDGGVPRQGFEALWRSINGDESWGENPWVWVVEFKVVEA